MMEETRMKDLLRRLQSDESGQGLVEYLLIIALIALGSVVTMSTAANSIAQAFSKVNSSLSSAIPS